MVATPRPRPQTSKNVLYSLEDMAEAWYAGWATGFHGDGPENPYLEDEDEDEEYVRLRED